MMFDSDPTEFGIELKVKGVEAKPGITFEMDAEQCRKLGEWLSSRPPKYEGAIGGRYTYSFTPTGLGTVVEVEDTLLKEKINLTDYESW